MTKKNARKTAARERQAKTGQSYQSALRAEGPPDSEILTGVVNLLKSLSKSVGDGLDRKLLGKDLRLEEPKVRAHWSAGYLVALQDVLRVVESRPTKWPEPPAPQYRVPKVVSREPQKVRDYWETLPEAKRCMDSKRRLLGVTDDHPEKPLTTWVTLTSVKDCPSFGEWWKSLPEAKPYNRG